MPQLDTRIRHLRSEAKRQGLEAENQYLTVALQNLALLRTSKLIHHEARSARWEKTRKCFVAPNHLQSVLNAAITPQFNWLNKIILDFTMDGWFKFFGIDIWTNFQIDSSRSLGYLLSTMPGLDYLQMWFRSPDDGHNTSPWGGSSVINPPYICCQRVMVDWIMTFAWPFIKSLSKVTIGGAVKKDSKVKWDGLFALSSTDKGTVLDQPTEERAILNTHPSQLPPACSCRTSCGVSRPTRYQEDRQSYKVTDDFDYEDDGSQEDDGSHEDDGAGSAGAIIGW